MPGGDGTGPLGFGPGTGWGTGYCMGARSRGFFGPRRRGFHRFGSRGVQPYYPGERYSEKEILQREAEFLKEELRQVEARLQEGSDPGREGL